jgi:hypothetical protein
MICCKDEKEKQVSIISLTWSEKKVKRAESMIFSKNKQTNVKLTFLKGKINVDPLMHFHSVKTFPD